MSELSGERILHRRYDCVVLRDEEYDNYLKKDFEELKDIVKKSGKEIMILKYDGNPLVEIIPKVVVNMALDV